MLVCPFSVFHGLSLCPVPDLVINYFCTFLSSANVLTYYILQDSTQKVIARSMVCPLDVNNLNIRVYVPSDAGKGIEDGDNEHGANENPHTEKFLETE